jgi:eukaryotic-like serine/threonine-protein kinase
MNSTSEKNIAEWFAELVDLPPAQRNELLASANLSEPDRAKLSKLFDVDSLPSSATLEAAVNQSFVALNAPLSSGRKLGAWQIGAELGAGGMGRVFLAQRSDGQYEDIAAVKVLYGFASEDSIRRLRIERQILAELDHPNIARLLDGGETSDGQPYLVMEYVPGTDIAHYVAEKALTLRERLALLSQVLMAIQHAHSHLVIHRDIKPRNVLVRADGVVKLLDFGVAKLLDLGDTERADKSSTRVWTPGYASPEQQDGRNVTTASDIYSFAVLMAELLGQGAPFETAAEIGTTGKPSALRLPNDLRSIIAKARAAAPADRYQTAAALNEDLQRFLSGQPVRATERSLPYLLKKFVLRHRWIVAFAALLLLLTTAFIWRLNSERNRALMAESRATQESILARESEAFVVSVFEAADPQMGSGRNVDLTALLAQASKRSSSTFKDQPLQYARVQQSLARIYRNLGEINAAATLLESVVPAMDPTEPELALQVASNLSDLGSTYMRGDQHEKALAVFNRAAHLRARFAASNSAEQLTAFVDLGFAYSWHEDLDAAEKQFNTGIAKARALIASSQDTHEQESARESLAAMLSELGQVQRRRGDVAQAVSTTAAALAIARGTKRGNDLSLIEYLRSNASALLDSDDRVAAEKLLREALTVQLKLIGPSGTSYANIQNDLGTVFVPTGRYAQAISAFEEALKAEGAASKADGYSYAVSLNNLASVYELYGDYARSIALFREAQSRLSDQTNPDFVQLLASNLARSQILHGDYLQALRGLQMVEAKFKTMADVNPISWVRLHMRYILHARFTGDWTAASNHLRELDSTIAKMPDTPRSLRNQVQRIRAAILIGTNHPDQAIKILQTVRADMIEDLGEAHPDVAIVSAELARAQQLRGDVDQAKKLYEVALPVLRKTLAPTERNRVDAEANARQIEPGSSK